MTSEEGRRRGEAAPTKTSSFCTLKCKLSAGSDSGDETPGHRDFSSSSCCPAHCFLFSTGSETMLGSLRSCAARRPANLMATSFARRTKAGSAESVTSSVSLRLSFSIWASGICLGPGFPAFPLFVWVVLYWTSTAFRRIISKYSCSPNLSLPPFKWRCSTGFWI